jgi:hypothetical protein
MSISSQMTTTRGRGLTVAPDRCQRDLLWEQSRNSLGIARLLVQEGRPAALVETASRLAAESACRAALAQAGLPFDGDLERALVRLAAPREIWEGVWPEPEAERLAAAERVVAWAARYLRSEAPEHSWGY